MSLIYITGPSGSGKSSVTTELIGRGFEAYDADKELCSWYDNETGQKVAYPRDAASRPADWQRHHSFLMSEEMVKELKEKSDKQIIFICGMAPNDLELAPRFFDRVILLQISEAAMVNRVTARKNNKYGQSPDQLAVIRQWYEPTIQKYRNFGAVVIDAEQPIPQVISDILFLLSLADD